ncbi:50S ribosomal protein L25/general stress protein Ctc [Pelagibius litoralis]|uniref:Large ribosomal subunit protein bL25 n=1 Tax=Pelagibius litoralis TaxID=374515 RepID=A0A967F2L4_9PROT|nr:50S ribosomal protein L25/general stress protein Ctc [Pelagibius litoralis]NIA71945.1 50S ribosomal protein L25/general stress protein Ctc [Pelagibius litoralis]
MSDVVELPADERERAGKGPARAARRAGQVPGVIYGAKKDPIMIAVQNKQLNKLLHSGGFFSTLFDVKVGSKSERVLPRDVQFDPVTDQPVHVDFLRVSAATSVNVEVAVNFLNEKDCPGLTEGGVLNVVRYEIELACRADTIPQQIDIDLTGLQVGDGIHISMVKLPDGVEPTITDRDFTIATIAAPTVVTEEAAEAAAEAAAAEGEGEGEGSEEAKSEDESGDS